MFTVELIAKAWPQLEECFEIAGVWRRFSADLLALLRRLDEPEADCAAWQLQVEALFAAEPRAAALLRRLQAMPSPPSPPPSVPARRDTRLQSPWAAVSAEPRHDVARGGSDDRSEAEKGLSPEGEAEDRPDTTESEREGAEAPEVVSVRTPNKRRTLISVLYATDRGALPRPDGSVSYSSEPADVLSFGCATVSLPDDHKKGALERPRWYRLEFTEDPKRDVVIAERRDLNHEQFVREAQRARERDGSEAEALLFVHGYRVSFDESIRRTAQIAVDLEFRGLALAFSWPSKASLIGYGADANVSESSMFMLARFIRIARAELGLRRLHVVAHSMGSRVLARALNQHTLEPAPAGQAELNQVVFAAPDIDPKTFSRFAEVFTQCCQRCTLYASRRDLALNASSWIYQRRRAGDAGGPATVIHGVDTIDASKVDHSLLGHSYFSDRRTVLHDLHDLLERGVAPGERFGLTEVPLGAGRYWTFQS